MSHTLRERFMAILLLASVGPALHATPVIYTINFTGVGPPASGGFTYDPSIVAPFSSFMVAWSAFSFDFTDLANNDTQFNPCGAGAAGVLAQSSVCGTQSWSANFASDTLGFRFEDSSSAWMLEIAEVLRTREPYTAAGSYTITPPVDATPEPGTLAYTILPVAGLIALGRRRFSKGPSPSTARPKWKPSP